MNVLLIGYGKMGKMVEQAALEQGFSISAIWHPRDMLDLRRLNKQTLQKIDVAIDFSHPEGILERIRFCAEAGLCLVIGTTGWHDQLCFAQQLIEPFQMGCVYSPNFSIGVNLFIEIASSAAELLTPYHYDISEYEVHHRDKIDHPSGTAIALAEALLSKTSSKTRWTSHLPSGKIAPDHLHVSYSRCGYNPGTYTVMYDSPEDLIEIRHIARNRLSYAQGALIAAQWIVGRTGWYTFQDVLHDMDQKKHY